MTTRTTRVINEDTAPTVVQAGSSGNTIMLMTFVGLVVIVVAVLLILHFTTGIA